MLRITLVVILSTLVIGCDLALPLLKTKMGEPFDMLCELHRAVTQKKGLINGKNVLVEEEENVEIGFRLSFTESGLVNIGKIGGNNIASGERYSFDYRGIRVPIPMPPEKGATTLESALYIDWGLGAKWRLAGRYNLKDKEGEARVEFFGQCKIFEWD